MIGAGWRVTVLAPLRADYPEDLREVGVTRPRIRTMPPVSLKRPWRLVTLLERWRFKRFLAQCHREDPFHVLECQDYDGWLSKGNGLGIPTVIRLHGSNLLYDHELKRPGVPLLHELELKTLKQGTYWAGVSRFAFQQSLARCGESEHAGTVIYNAVDTDLFSPGPEDITESGLIVFVNSLNKRKGLDTLLKAMPLVLKDVPHARLAIVGGQLAAGSELHTIYSELPTDARQRIEFPGRLDRRTGVLSWLRRAQVCCYPSRVETFGLAPVEAMAVGKATVYSRTGAGPEVIEDGISGLLCDPESSDDLAERLISLLTSEQRTRELGTAGRKTVLEKFTRKHWADANSALYAGLRKL